MTKIQKHKTYTYKIRSISEDQLPEELLIFLDAYYSEMQTRVLNLQRNCPKDPKTAIFCIKDCEYWKKAAQYHAQNIYTKYPNTDSNSLVQKVTLSSVSKGTSISSYDIKWNDADENEFQAYQNQASFDIPVFDAGDFTLLGYGKFTFGYDFNFSQNAKILNKYIFQYFSNKEAQKTVIDSETGERIEFSPGVLNIYICVQYN